MFKLQLKLIFFSCLLATFGARLSDQLPTGTSLKCSYSSDCPIGFYCKDGACLKPVLCQDDSVCNADQCCGKYSWQKTGVCIYAPKASHICHIKDLGVPSCSCVSGLYCKAVDFSDVFGVCSAKS